MASYGFEHSLSLGDINEGTLKANQAIHLKNLSNMTKYQNSINKTAGDTLDRAKEQLTTIVGEQMATKGKAVMRSYEGAKQLAGAASDASKTIFSKVPVSKAVQLETKGGNLLGHSGDMTNVGMNFEKAGIGDIAGAGLQVGLGAIDLAGDIKAGKITGDNFLERAGNVLDMAAAGLEAGGVAADLTGVLAPEGIVANAIGGVVGLAGGIADLAGDLEQTLAPHNPAAAPKTVGSLATLVTGSTGAEVKENIQGSGGGAAKMGQ